MNKKAYFSSLPKKYMSSGVLFFNDKNEVLVLHPTYKDRWEIPGGIIEKNESPKDAVVREIQEELGLSVQVNQLLVCEYTKSLDIRPDSVQFIFYGGILSKKQIASIKLDNKEIQSFEFLKIHTENSRSEIAKRPRLGPRLLLALKAYKENTCFYVE